MLKQNNNNDFGEILSREGFKVPASGVDNEEKRDKGKNLSSEDLQIAARIQAMQAHLRSEISSHPHLKLHVDMGLLNIDPTKMSSSSLRGLLATVSSMDKQVTTEEDHEDKPSLIGSIIDKCRDFFGKKRHCNDGLEVAVKELGALKPSGTIPSELLIANKNQGFAKGSYSA